MTNIVTRSFLPASDKWRVCIDTSCKVGYAFISKPGDDNEVFVRCEQRRDGITNELCVAGKPQVLVRPITSPLSLEQAKELFGRCGTRKLRLTRHCLQTDGRVTTVDVFGENLSALTVIRVEAPTNLQLSALPAWLDQEITNRPDYSYANLASHGLPPEFHTWHRARYGLLAAF